MKLAIISSLGSRNSQDVLRAAERHAIEATIFPLSKMAFSVDEAMTQPFFTYDVYLFRAYNTNFSLARSLAQFLTRQGKIVIDQHLATDVHTSKLHEAFVYQTAAIPHIPTYSASNSGTLLSSTTFSYPVVVKDIASQKGKGVRLCLDEASLRQEIDRNRHTILIQDYVPIKYDIRVLCIGDEVIGAVKRESVGDDFRTNVSLGGRASVYELSKAETSLALRAHQAFGYDISGVDLAHHANGDAFVIETNIAPEWQGFAAATGIDIGEKVIEHIMQIEEQS